MSGEIPYGYCHCGCGQKTKLANWTDKRIGAVKGEPYRYLNGHSTKVPVQQRFWLYVEKTDGCWEWKGNRHKQGYGLIGDSNRGKTIKGHRLSWEIHFGPIPKGMSVLHKCDNPPCCNPEHLFLGSQYDNMKDCATKGRIKTTPKYGEDNHYSKLTADMVLDMRKTRRETGMSYKKIAAEFGVTTMTAHRAITGKCWSHLEG